MSDTAPIRVLFVEDDDEYAKFVGEELQASGAAIFLQRVSTLSAALHTLTDEAFDAVLLDLGLVDSDGLDTVARVYAAAASIAIVVLTARDDDRLADSAMQRGAQDYLVKSAIDGRRLQTALRRAYERAAIGRALQESEARKSAIIETAFDAIVTIDRTGRISEFNRAAEQMFGHAREDALGQEVGHLIVPHAYRERHFAALAAYDSSAPLGLLRRRLELEGLRADGTTFPMELALVSLPSSQGPLFTAFMRDLSEQREAERALRKSEDQLRQAHKMEAVGQLAGGVAHDFNNVLTAILGYADLLMDEFTEDDPRRADLQEIRRAADRAAGLTRQLLAFSRKQVMQPRILNLNDIIMGVETLLARLVTNDILISVRPSPDLWRVRADPGQIEQVLMNLAANARDAMPHGGRLLLETANVTVTEVDDVHRPGLKPGDYVALTVTDTGEGMAEEVRAHVFEPFFTTKEQGKGTGLGLATVYGIVKQTEGAVYVENHQGQGARFVIYLPRVPDPS
jgi:hypothetical protein